MANSLNREYWEGLLGKRIELIRMSDDPRPMESGSIGTVMSVCLWPDQTWSVSVNWENTTRRLSLVCPPDQFIILD